MGSLKKLLFGSSGEGEAAKERAALMAQSQASLNKALAQWEGVEIPQLEKLKLQMQYPELVGTLEAEQLGPSLLGEIETDPRLREAQMRALSELQTMSSEGLTPEQESMFADLKEQGEMARKSKEADIMASLERRGLVGGEGEAARSEMLMKQQSSQAMANEEARAARRMAAEQASAMRGATMQSGQLAGQMDAQDYQRAAQAEQARASIEAANASNRQDVARQNLTAAQQIANDRVNLANQTEMAEQGYNVQIPQQNFANQTAIASALSGMHLGQAGMASQQAGNIKPQASSGIMPLVGAGLGAWVGSSGGAQGAATGANVGASLGGGLSSMFQSKEDGGVIENSAPTTGNLKQVYADKPAESEIKRLTKLLGAVDKYANGGTVAAPIINGILDSARVPEEVHAENGKVIPGQMSTPMQESPLMGKLFNTSQEEKNYTPMTSKPLYSPIQDLAVKEGMSLDELSKDNFAVVGDKIKDLARGFKKSRAEEADAAQMFDDSEKGYQDAEFDRLMEQKADYESTLKATGNKSNVSEPDQDMAPSKKEMSKKDVENYAKMAESIMGGLAQMREREVDDGWKAPVIRSSDFAPQRVSVASPLKIPSVKLEYGGVVPSMKGFVNTATDGNAYTSNGSVQNINTAYKTDDAGYFRKSAIESYAKLRSSPVGNINDTIGLQSIPLPSGTDQMFADGGLPKLTPKESAFHETAKAAQRLLDNLGALKDDAARSKALGRAVSEFKSHGISYDDAMDLMRNRSKLDNVVHTIGQKIGTTKLGGTAMGVAAPSSVAKEYAAKELAEKKAGSLANKKDLAKMIDKKRSVKMVGGAAFDAGENTAKKGVKSLLGKFARGAGKQGLKTLGVATSLPAMGLMEMLRSENVAAAELPQAEQDDRKATNQAIKELASKYECGGRVKHYEEGGAPVEGYDSDVDEEIIDGTSYVGDRVDAKVNSGEMVLNVDQQQRLMELLRGEIAPEELPNEDVVRPAEEDETNLHEKNEELEARLSAIEGLLKRGV